MQRESRPVVVSVVLTVLVLTIGPASAQEAPTSPEVGVCLPGAGYAPGCDVDQDGDVDIFDIQLTAGRWNSSGIYTPGHTHWGETWTDASGSWGLRLDHTATSGAVYGLVGTSLSPAGRGIRGYAGAASGAAYGVEGQSASQAGAGVYGWVTAASGATNGVVGRSESTSGTGVYGYVTAGSGSSYGVRGQSYSSSGIGVLGDAAALSGVTYGVWGASSSTNGWGGYFLGRGLEALYAQNTASGRAIQAYAPSDTAVWAKTDIGFAGVDAWNSSTAGRGVSGWAIAATGNTHGVWGQSASSSGTGVLAPGRPLCGRRHAAGRSSASSLRGAARLGRRSLRTGCVLRPGWWSVAPGTGRNIYQSNTVQTRHGTSIVHISFS